MCLEGLVVPCLGLLLNVILLFVIPYYISHAEFLRDFILSRREVLISAASLPISSTAITSSNNHSISPSSFPTIASPHRSIIHDEKYQQHNNTDFETNTQPRRNSATDRNATSHYINQQGQTVESVGLDSFARELINGKLQTNQTQIT